MPPRSITPTHPQSTLREQHHPGTVTSPSRDGATPNSETLLEYTPDYAIEHAGHLIDHCAKLGVTLPADELRDRMPEWASLLYDLPAKRHLR
jgi:hypothetical protein